MLTKQKISKIRNHGVATMTILSTFVATGAVVVAQSAKKGLDTSVDPNSSIAVEIFEDTNKTGNTPIFQQVVNLLLFLVGSISVVMLIIGGIRYIVSSGDQNQVTGAKNTIMYAIIGIVVSVLAWGVVNFLLDSLYPTP